MLLSLVFRCTYYQSPTKPLLYKLTIVSETGSSSVFIMLCGVRSAPVCIPAEGKGDEQQRQNDRRRAKAKKGQKFGA